MANELVYSGAPATDTGLTIVGRVYGMDGVQVSTDVTMTEVGVLAIYRGDMPTASAGQYIVKFYNSTTLQQQFRFYWSGTAEITVQTLNAQLAQVTADLDAQTASLKITIEDAAFISP